MIRFTDNPLEGLMQQKPTPGMRKDRADVETFSDTQPDQPVLFPIPAPAAKLQRLGTRCSSCRAHPLLQTWRSYDKITPSESGSSKEARA